MLYMYRLVRYMYISFDVYDCGKCTNTAALEMSDHAKGVLVTWGGGWRAAKVDLSYHDPVTPTRQTPPRPPSA